MAFTCGDVYFWRVTTTENVINVSPSKVRGVIAQVESLGKRHSRQNRSSKFSSCNISNNSCRETHDSEATPTSFVAPSVKRAALAIFTKRLHSCPYTWGPERPWRGWWRLGNGSNSCPVVECFWLPKRQIYIKPYIDWFWYMGGNHKMTESVTHFSQAWTSLPVASSTLTLGLPPVWRLSQRIWEVLLAQSRVNLVYYSLRIGIHPGPYVAGWNQRSS